jgi:hypothetical protein
MPPPTMSREGREPRPERPPSRSPSRPSSRPPSRPPSRSRSPGSRLERHLRSIMQQNGLDYNLYKLPISPSPYIRGEVFTVNELQPNGLENDGNVCPIISIILSFHRLRLKDY